MSAHKPNGIMKTLIAYAKIAWAIALIKTSFPPLEKKLAFLIRYLIKYPEFDIIEKQLAFFLPTIDGNPKYFLCLDTTLSYNMFFISLICLA